MFEKEAEERTEEKYACNEKPIMPLEAIGYKKGFKDGAEFGYNKANEWHYVENEGTPTKKGHYLVCLRDKAHSILDCWIWFDKDIGWYSLQVRLVDIFAWKEIVLPKESK